MSYAQHSHRSLFRLPAALLLLMCSAAAHTADWRATRTAALPLAGSGAVDNGPMAATVPLPITVSLKLRDRTGLDDFIRRLGTPGDALYGQYLSPEDFIARYAPTQARTLAVARYLRNKGFKKVRIAKNRLLITAEGTAGTVNGAFDAGMHVFSYHGRSHFANTRTARIPAALQDSVLAVIGLQNLAEVRTMYDMAPQTVGPFAYNPTALPQAYNAGSTGDGAQTDVAIISFGNMKQTIADLRAFETANGLPQVPVQTVPVGGASLFAIGVPEWNLDSQSIQAMAGGSVKSITFYAANPFSATRLGIGFLSAAFNQAVIDNKAKIINASLGNCESLAKLQGVTDTDDQIFAQAAAQGQTFVVASGDGGSNTGCLAHEGKKVQTSYPASSPYVLAVGGTSLTTTVAGGGDYVSETAWVLGGGGISAYAPVPAWQSAYVAGSYRSVPDVAIDADPNTGANILLRGDLLTVGGTSLAAPLFSGILARAQTANGNALGFAAPLVYAVATQAPAAFHDVTIGSNGAYNAQAGFDQTTGLGSPDITLFVNTLGSL